jgi:Domain of unknown function (DUF4329)
MPVNRASPTTISDFFFSPPVPGTADDSDPNASPIPDGATVVGNYHTHAGAFDWTDEYPSSEDVLKAPFVPQFIGTPRGRVLVVRDVYAQGVTPNCERGSGSFSITELRH